MNQCPVCQSSDLKRISTIKNMASWLRRFTNPFELPQLVIDTLKGIGNQVRYFADSNSVAIGVPMQCSNCGNYLVLCNDCRTITRTSNPSGGTGRTCNGCGKPMNILDI